MLSPLAGAFRVNQDHQRIQIELLSEILPRIARFGCCEAPDLPKAYNVLSDTDTGHSAYLWGSLSSFLGRMRAGEELCCVYKAYLTAPARLSGQGSSGSKGVNLRTLMAAAVCRATFTAFTWCFSKLTKWKAEFNGYALGVSLHIESRAIWKLSCSLPPRLQYVRNISFTIDPVVPGISWPCGDASHDGFARTSDACTKQVLCCFLPP